MHTLAVGHPLVAQAITRMRDETTDRAGFRAATDDVSSMLVYEATRRIPHASVAVRTPLTETTGVVIDRPPLLVPILRAGLGMLAGAQRWLPGSDTGFVGVARNEESFAPVPYMNSVPADLERLDVLILDPMLATGGSLAHAAELLRDHNAGTITAVCILAAPEGVRALGAAGVVDQLVVGAIDDHLNDRAFIVPGLGDAGDRLFGLH